MTTGPMGFQRVYQAWMNALHDGQTPSHVTAQELDGILDAAHLAYGDVVAGKVLSGELSNTQNPLRSIFESTRLDRPAGHQPTTMDPVASQKLLALLQRERVRFPSTPQE